MRLGEPDTSYSSRSIALTLWGRYVVIHLIMNAYWDALDFEVPPLEPGVEGWRRIFDTSLEAAVDLTLINIAPSVDSPTYRAGPRSVVVLASRRHDATPEVVPA